MRLLDFLVHFDAAMDWPLDDPFLVDDEMPVRTGVEGPVDAAA